MTQVPLDVPVSRRSGRPARARVCRTGRRIGRSGGEGRQDIPSAA